MLAVLHHQLLFNCRAQCCCGFITNVSSVFFMLIVTSPFLRFSLSSLVIFFFSPPILPLSLFLLSSFTFHLTSFSSVYIVFPTFTILLFSLCTWTLFWFPILCSHWAYKQVNRCLMLTTTLCVATKRIHIQLNRNT